MGGNGDTVSLENQAGSPISPLASGPSSSLQPPTLQVVPMTEYMLKAQPAYISLLSTMQPVQHSTHLTHSTHDSKTSFALIKSYERPRITPEFLSLEPKDLASCSQLKTVSDSKLASLPSEISLGVSEKLSLNSSSYPISSSSPSTLHALKQKRIATENQICKSTSKSPTKEGKQEMVKGNVSPPQAPLSLSCSQAVTGCDDRGHIPLSAFGITVKRTKPGPSLDNMSADIKFCVGSEPVISEVRDSTPTVSESVSGTFEMDPPVAGTVERTSKAAVFKSSMLKGIIPSFMTDRLKSEKNAADNIF